MVGGADKGGILVRDGESTSSTQLTARLSALKQPYVPIGRNNTQREWPCTGLSNVVYMLSNNVNVNVEDPVGIRMDSRYSQALRLKPKAPVPRWNSSS